MAYIINNKLECFMFFLFASSYMLGDKFVDGRRIEPTENKGLIERKGTIKTIEVFFFFFWRQKKKGTQVWQSLSHAPRYSWVSPWVPLARTGARKLRTRTHHRLYWFLGLSKIVITVLVRTQTWDVMKPQQSPTSCITPASDKPLRL